MHSRILLVVAVLTLGLASVGVGVADVVVSMHNHTYYSDGFLSPKLVSKVMFWAGAQVVVITDHAEMIPEKGSLMKPVTGHHARWEISFNQKEYGSTGSPMASIDQSYTLIGLKRENRVVVPRPMRIGTTTIVYVPNFDICKLRAKDSMELDDLRGIQSGRIKAPPCLFYLGSMGATLRRAP
jgi:hypothetical protein